jgi:hypothetical protein
VETTKQKGKRSEKKRGGTEANIQRDTSTIIGSYIASLHNDGSHPKLSVISSRDEIYMENAIGSRTRMPSMVSDVSAMFVAMTIFRAPGGVVSKIFACGEKGAQLRMKAKVAIHPPMQLRQYLGENEEKINKIKLRSTHRQYNPHKQSPIQTIFSHIRHHVKAARSILHMPIHRKRFSLEISGVILTCLE